MKLTGKIIVGQGRGKGLGVPTLNLDHNPQALDHGVYAVRVFLNGKCLNGAMNWGPRPTFQENEPVAEIHVLDFDGDIYGQEIEVEVVEKIRDIQNFETTSALTEAIQKDIAAIRAILL